MAKPDAERSRRSRSGNRNCHRRVSLLMSADRLASPPLALAYPLAGTENVHSVAQPPGRDGKGDRTEI